MSNSQCVQEHPRDACGCGDSASPVAEPTTCTGGITIPTLEEQHILAQIREVKEEAQGIKEAIRQLEGHAIPPVDELAALHDQLQALRLRRKSLEEQRVKAAHERMRLLGHA